MTNQSLQQASVRALTGTTYGYNGDWHALFDLDGIPVGPWDQRMLAWINQQLPAEYTGLPDALAAFAAANGAASWNSLGTIGNALGFVVLMENGGAVLLEDASGFVALQ